jgi:hypothetical protein
MSKREMRERLAGLSFSEKIKILEMLRNRSLAIAATRAKSGSGAPKPTRNSRRSDS